MDAPQLRLNLSNRRSEKSSEKGDVVIEEWLQCVCLIFMLVLSGCGMKDNHKQGSDDNGSSKSPYHRIVSLMPSNTEILYELGLGKYIVGVSTVDDYPKDVKKGKKQFDALNLNKEELLKAKPDLILAHESQKARMLIKYCHH